MGENLAISHRCMHYALTIGVLSLLTIRCGTNSGSTTHYRYVTGAEWSPLNANRILITKQEFDFTDASSSGCGTETAPTSPPAEAYELFLTDTSGKVVRQLSSSLGLSRTALFRWSPTADRIVIWDNSHAPLRTLDTNGIVQTYSTLLAVSSASWSPDGSTIVCSALMSGGRYSLYKVAPSGGTVSLLYSTLATGPVAWSSQDQIAFVTVDSASAKLWVMSSDGSNLQRLDSSAAFYALSFSPDGNTLIYSRTTQVSNEVVEENLSTHAQQMLLQFTDGTEVVSLRHSPDGTTLSYYSFTSSSQVDLYIIGVDGSNATFVATLSTDGSWSPDSRRIAYVLENSVKIKSVK
ncbi:MAG TPA: hypothetical protein VLY03_05865 [Bacteroidota bacterium]|nr:hypothetical protein [Bacteroidota bacterium]